MRQGEAYVKSQSVTFWQAYSASNAWTDATAITGLATPKYRLTNLPGITIVKAGSSIEAGAPITVAVVRVEAQGFGAIQNSDNTSASSYQLKSMYIKR